MSRRLSDGALTVIVLWAVFSIPWLIGVWMGVGDQGGLTWRAVVAGAAPFLVGVVVWHVVRRWRD
jgi:hypothetical protein